MMASLQEYCAVTIRVTVEVSFKVKLPATVKLFFDKREKIYVPKGLIEGGSHETINNMATARGQYSGRIVANDNEDIYKKSTGKALTSGDVLNTEEAIGTFTGKKIEATLFRGVTPTYEVWVILFVAILGACVISSGYGVSGHHFFY
jgi:hypothetical protein